ncbi:glycosyltransferase [Paenibacillus sp. N1-5-1-14]|uniref:glycosyltransferase family 2 protein n=1 Tax=Paenibacillus radicibacter TaxID=2972488 RepID=UPI00215922F6|nr:glycosyltransferase family 2 protein [Paenibacillus radicibacter]MCR8643477.1 glycosyltransferase [Paenibacillus radicibacter]
MKSQRIGEALIDHGIITSEQLDEAINYQTKNGGRLGEIVIELFGINRDFIHQITQTAPQKVRLGEMLVNTGQITQEQLNRALQFQQHSGGVLGDILLSLRFIEPDQLYRAIATQNNLGRIGKEFSFELEHKLPEAVARSYNAIIINRRFNRYIVAVSQILSQDQISELEAYLDCPIELVMATRDEMEFFWKEVYAEELMHESTEKLIYEKPENSAHITFTWGQKMSFYLCCGLFIFGLFWNWLWSLILLNIIIQVGYMIMSVFKYSILLFGAKKTSQLRFTDEEIAAIDERELPIYSILVPIYKESNIIPQLLNNINNLDYPKSKLDVRLLIEEDDVEAQQLLAIKKLPAYFTVLIVPHSLPKTKPKACNYGLIRARGEYVVIYDAEDRPDPDQLKKVYLAFKTSPDNCCCIQAKLNYFNNNQNLLTRWFTHEYSMWFELLLPGVMQLDIPIPLGGTSNHFKTDILKKINAWDPYNVTEDADLGVRLYKEGYKTAIVDSRTWEEATSRVGNWIRQRSRWIKGYMQTWLVHMRNPVQLWRDLGTRGFLGFHAMVLATPLLPLLNPIFWAMVLLWYLAKMEIIALFFPGPIYYIAAVEFFVGNFIFMYSLTAGIYWVTKDLHSKGNKTFSFALIKYTLLTPIYWVLLSIAAVKAAIQLITKPFYWEKTAHGHATTDTQQPESTIRTTMSAIE